MKSFLRHWFINAITLSIIDWFFPGLTLSYYLTDIILATLLLTAILKLIKPIFDIVFLPINLVTLGLFKWVKTLIALVIVIYIAPGVSLEPFYFDGAIIGGFTLPAFMINPIIALVISSLGFNFLKKAVLWVLKKGK